MAGRWKVQVLGSLFESDDEEPDYEISVVNEKATEHWGWGCEDKVILFSVGGDNELNPGTKAQFDFAIRAANVLCDGLNAQCAQEVE